MGYETYIMISYSKNKAELQYSDYFDVSKFYEKIIDERDPSLLVQSVFFLLKKIQGIWGSLSTHQ